MKGMFKTALCGVFACTLLCGSVSYAEKPTYGIGELREQAAEGWHRVYQTPRGEVRIDVDAFVPDVDAFPVYRARKAGTVEGIPQSRNDLAEVGEEGFSNETGYFRCDWPSNSIQRSMMKTAQKEKTFIFTFGEPQPLVLKYDQYDPDTAYAVNNPTTMNSAADLLRECLDRFMPERRISFEPHYICAHVEPAKYTKDKNTGDYIKGQEDPNFQGVFFGYFNQKIGGIPVLGLGFEGYANWKGSNRDGEIGHLGITCITQGMADKGSAELYRSLQFSLLETTEVLSGDIRLCTFGKVLETAGELIEAGKLRTVDSLRLGYTAWQEKKNGPYTLFPTWVIEGELFETATSTYKEPVTILSEKPLEYTYVFINAQTGELIDPWNKSKKRAYDMPKLIK